MTEGVAVALIGLGGSALGTVLGIVLNTKLITYRIEQLEQKVAAHNNLIDRMYKVEGKERLSEERIEELQHKVEHLESYH
jgi:sensor histidine kinase YesM